MTANEISDWLKNENGINISARIVGSFLKREGYVTVTRMGGARCYLVRFRTTESQLLIRKLMELDMKVERIEASL